MILKQIPVFEQSIESPNLRKSHENPLVLTKHSKSLLKKGFRKCIDKTGKFTMKFPVTQVYFQFIHTYVIKYAFAMPVYGKKKLLKTLKFISLWNWILFFIKIQIDS